jgi:tetratricopeptide (TPR) repeat protein
MRTWLRLPRRPRSGVGTKRSRAATGKGREPRFSKRSTDSAEALDGLGRALWWLRDERGAVVHRERAYAGFRRDGELARAARVALWLAREYGIAFDNDAAARGWLARAERLLRDVAPGAERGWLELARSEGARDAATAAELATTALDVALAAHDPDLELRALAQLGLAEVTLGDVDKGLARLDEAMAAATSGEPANLETFADICCTLMLACERAGDSERPQQWSTVLDEFVRSYDHVTLLAFCRTCCADVFAANGRIDAAEAELEQAIRELAAAGQRSRCIPPSARLAEIRALQGRLDEAEQLLGGSSPNRKLYRRACRFVWREASRDPRPPCSSSDSTSSVGRTFSLRRCSRSWSRHDWPRTGWTTRERLRPRSTSSPRAAVAIASLPSPSLLTVASRSPRGATTRLCSCGKR